MATDQTPRQKIEAELAEAMEKINETSAEVEDEKSRLAELETRLNVRRSYGAALNMALAALGPAPRRGRPAAGAAASANGERAPRVRKPRMTVAQRAVAQERTAAAEERE